MGYGKSLDFKQMRVENKIFSLGLSDEDIQEMENVAQTFKDWKAKWDIGIVYKPKDSKKAWGIVIRRDMYRDSEVEISEVKRGLDDEKEVIFKLKELKFAFVPTYEQYKEIEVLETLRETISNEYRYGGSPDRLFTSYELMIEWYKDVFFTGSIQDKTFEDIDAEENMKAICNLYGVDYSKVLLAFSGKEFPDDYNKIIMVIERNNKRLFAYQKEGVKKIGFARVEAGNEAYNYVDVGRVIIGDVTYHRKLFLLDDLVDYDMDILQKIKSESNELALGQKSYEAYKKKVALKVMKERREKELRDKYVEEMDKMKEDIIDKSFTFNEMDFSGEGVVFGDAKLSVISVEGVKTKEFNCNFVKSLDLKSNTDFNEVFTTFCNDVLKIGKFVKAQMGKVMVEYEPKESKAKEGGYSSTHAVLHYVNGKRINQADVVEVLERAICFQTTEQFNELVEQVSRISLKYHEALNHGLCFTFTRYETDAKGYSSSKDYIMRLRLRRTGNSYSLICKKEIEEGKIEEKEFKIKNSNKMLSYSHIGNKRSITFNEVFNMLNETLEGVSSDDLVEIVREGLKEQKVAEEKAQKLLEKTIAMLHIKQGELAISETEKVVGYIVPGKMRKYFLTEDMKVYDFETKRYFCVVDKQSTQRVHKDRIVNRMMALANDDRLVRDIHTLA